MAQETFSRRTAKRDGADEIRAAGGQAMARVADALDEGQLREARGELLGAWGRIDALVNAAGGNVARVRNDARPIFDGAVGRARRGVAAEPAWQRGPVAGLRRGDGAGGRGVDRVRAGRTPWNELVHRYDQGIDSVRAMRQAWDGLRGKIDDDRFRRVSTLLGTQEKVARWARRDGPRDPRLSGRGAVTDPERPQHLRTFARRLATSQEAGLVMVLALVTLGLTLFAGSHFDRVRGATVNDFWNSHTLIQTATDASFFAIMAVGATVVIISGGIDLSVGSIYALAGVTMALVLRAAGPLPPAATVLLGLVVCTGVGLVCGLINGGLVVGLRVHPFIITLGTMWMLRGVAFVASRAESILTPESLTGFAKAPLGLGGGLYPVPMLAMILAAVAGSIYLTRTVMGRHVFAFGGNLEASRFAGLPLNRIQIGVFAVSGLTAGIAAFLGAAFYGSASSGDAQGYELYVIAAAVVGGASLVGGKGSALGATLGALLIVLFRQSIRTLHLDQNYEWIVIGGAIIVAVVVDQWSARMTARRLSRGAETSKAVVSAT